MKKSRSKTARLVPALLSFLVSRAIDRVLSRFAARGGSPLRVRAGGDVHERVDVRQHAEVPHEAGAFEPPEAPAVRFLTLAIERQMDAFDAAVATDDLHHFIDV